MPPLTDPQCDAFRRLNLSFNDMVREIYAAGQRSVGATEREALASQITSYLSGGGLFNPELAHHEAVRDLLIACRTALATPSIGSGSHGVLDAVQPVHDKRCPAALNISDPCKCGEAS
ncbi:hypothetical protein QTI05_22505 [Variovorax sp. J22R193]|uniref:hypothetical protein n=1 Tax=Variovorax fucosicus TaxID=3053517 RepID=UPI002577908C|nr:hypothetical protein [Variovorax sp. J22R193]MDM0041829.1 hypothetical protein [Variovorax sp. J22R193]